MFFQFLDHGSDCVCFQLTSGTDPVFMLFDRQFIDLIHNIQHIQTHRYIFIETCVITTLIK